MIDTDRKTVCKYGDDYNEGNDYNDEDDFNHGDDCSEEGRSQL